jgi:DNA-binding NarL/FixJ family response regulator
MPTSVLIADDHKIVRQGIRALLEREGLAILGEASNGQEAVTQAAGLQPDVIVMDIGMPLLNGVDAARELARASPKSRIVLLTRHDDDQYVIAALKAGVRGYVLKSQAAGDLIAAIREVTRGGTYLGPGISKTVVDAFLTKTPLSEERLTARERQVLQMIGEGNTSKEIAALLGISVKTAESHRTRLMHKLDIHATAGLVRYAIRHGLIEP